MVYLFRDWYNKLFKLNSRLDLKYKAFLKKINSSELICAQVINLNLFTDFQKK